MTTFDDSYSTIKKIGEGTFSEVWKVRHKKTGDYYAAKKLIKNYMTMNEVLSCEEVQTMRALDHHPAVTDIVEVVYDTKLKNLYLIFELFDMNLFDYIKNRSRCLSEVCVKRIMYQLTAGLNHLHRSGIFHRDIKPENILVKTDSRLTRLQNEIVQIADLGSVTQINQAPPHSAYISTRWYRAPESLLTAGFYGSKIDVWALGCVFYELLTLKPLFAGENEIDQLHRIHNVLGVPNERILKSLRHVNVSYTFPTRNKPIGLHTLVPALSDNGLDILRQMLQYLPRLRITAARLCEHGYFNDLRSHANKVSKAFSSTAALSSFSSTVNVPLRKPRSMVTASKTEVLSEMKFPITLFSRSNLSAIPKRGIFSHSTSTRSLDMYRKSMPSMVEKTDNKLNSRTRERLWGMNPGNRYYKFLTFIIAKFRTFNKLGRLKTKLIKSMVDIPEDRTEV